MRARVASVSCDTRSRTTSEAMLDGCYLRESTTISSSVVGWAGHHEYELALNIPRWTPEAELTLAFPLHMQQMTVRKVMWATQLGSPRRSASTGGIELRLRLAVGNPPDPPTVRLTFISHSFQLGDQPTLEACSGNFPPTPPLSLR